MMPKQQLRLAVLGIGLVAALTTSASADTIGPIISTGFDLNGSLLANGSVDPHYSVSYNPTYPPDASSSYDAQTALVATANTGFPFPSWFAGDSKSQWLAATNRNNANYAALGGYFTFTNSFDAPMKGGTGIFTINVATDNTLVDILLNGTSVKLTTGSFPVPKWTTSAPTGFQSFTPLTFSGALSQTGINTLQYVVYNYPLASGNPAGLRVEVDSAVYVPEPSSILTMFGGSLLLTGMVWRRLRVAAAAR